MTSEAGRAEVAAVRAEQLEKEQRIEEKEKKKAAAAAETSARRITQGDNVEFKGPLHSHNKEGLQDIAFALRISLDGTKAALVDRINQHLDTHPELNTDSRFVGLYLSRSRGQKRAKPTDGIPANDRPTQRQRVTLQDVANVLAP